MDSEQQTDNTSTGDDSGGQGPTMAANGGRSPTVTPSEAHTLSAKEVAEVFEQAGIPRSPRSAERYCAAGKLDCIKDPDEGHWYVSKESVDSLVGQLKELQARHQRLEVPEPGATTSANGGQGPTETERQKKKRLQTVFVNGEPQLLAS